MILIFFAAWTAGVFLNFCVIFCGARLEFFRRRFLGAPSAPAKLGGLVVAGAFAAGMAVWFLSGEPMPVPPGIFWGLALAFVIGIVDDVRGLSPFLKLCGQTAVASAAVASGVRTEIAFFPPTANAVLSVAWFVLLMNALNLLDILDGLSGGITALCAAAFWYVSLKVGGAPAAAVAAALAGSNFAFLLLNFPRARIYLGEAGCLFNGTLLAAVAVMASYAGRGHEIALCVPLFILSLPLFDIFFLILMRIVHGRPVTRKSRDHLVLRLVSRGVSSTRAVLLMYVLNVFFSSAAVFLLRLDNVLGFAVLLAAVAAWGAIAYWAGQVKIEG